MKLTGLGAIVEGLPLGTKLGATEVGSDGVRYEQQQAHDQIINHIHM